MKIALDTQHKYKPAPKDNDKGVVFQGVYEADLVDKYFNAVPEDIEKKITLDLVQENIILIRNNSAQGILVGNYSDRIKWANDNKVDLYFAGHLNAGGGKYGLIEVVENKEEDLQLARNLAKMFSDELMNDDFRVNILRKKPDGTTDRGYSCIAGCNCPAFLLEPAFIDNPKHFDMLVNGDWINKIGKVILKFIKYYKEIKEV